MAQVRPKPNLSLGSYILSASPLNMPATLPVSPEQSIARNMKPQGYVIAARSDRVKNTSRPADAVFQAVKWGYDPDVPSMPFPAIWHAPHLGDQTLLTVEWSQQYLPFFPTRTYFQMGVFLGGSSPLVGGWSMEGMNGPGVGIMLQPGINSIAMEGPPEAITSFGVGPYNPPYGWLFIEGPGSPAGTIFFSFSISVWG